MPDEFLDIEALEHRQSAWRSRLAVETDRRWLLKAHDQEGELVGFACVELDAEPEWGALLDNLHVRPDRKGQGIGRRLFDAAREWSFEQLGHQGIHLWVIEANVEGQQFYNRIGGTIAERKIKDVVGVVNVAGAALCLEIRQPSAISSLLSCDSRQRTALTAAVRAQPRLCARPIEEHQRAGGRRCRVLARLVRCDRATLPYPASRPCAPSVHDAISSSCVDASVSDGLIPSSSRRTPVNSVNAACSASALIDPSASSKITIGCCASNRSSAPDNRWR